MPSPAAIANGSTFAGALSKNGLGLLRLCDSDGVKRSDFYFPPKNLTICIVYLGGAFQLATWNIRSMKKSATRKSV